MVGGTRAPRHDESAATASEGLEMSSDQDRADLAIYVSLKKKKEEASGGAKCYSQN